MEVGGEFQLHWEEDVEAKHAPARGEEHEYILGNVQGGSYPNVGSEMIQDTDQMAAENLMYLAQDTVYAEAEELECVTEEVITDDWSHEGQDRVEVPVEFLGTAGDHNVKLENDDDIPLPTDQDEYTAMRPWPCDFCSRRFRKKAALMNHMVAHQTDRPHACNLCGVRYVRKCDLMNHLKVHAFVPDNESIDFEDMLDNTQIVKPKKKRGRRKKDSETVENGVWEHMTSARTQQWSRRARSPRRSPRRSPPPRSPTPLSEPEPEPPPPLPPADPARPFVCRHCGVAFAREKALQSHARVHGGDSPMECYACGELCWSREALAHHTRTKHPHAPPRPANVPQPYNSDTEDDDDMDFRLSPGGGGSAGSRGSRAGSAERGPPPPALFCQGCGVAFQRADLLRRHVSAAHSYKRHDSTSSTWGEHACEVCGETCSDALQLLAHAELHAERHPTSHSRLKKISRGRNNTSTSSSSKQFPCRECGKVFGSRSSQQIHVRIHTGERPYACRFCWKAFADGGTLRKHERIHTGEKPYACAVCPRAFNQRVVLREHVRSHHSAAERRGGGFCCAVCARQLPSAAELVQHLIQHCDANTALKRQPQQSGPRKYKRRRKMMKTEPPQSPEDWARTEVESPSASPPPTPPPAPSPPPAPPPPPTPARRRRGPLPAPQPRPKMIHTEPTPRPRIKQVRQRRPPRRPADDLRAIRPPAASSAPSPPLLIKRSPSPRSSPSPPPSPSPSPGGTYKCEMCSLQFSRRDALLLHVPIHI